jgi:hypothetical protein
MKTSSQVKRHLRTRTSVHDKYYTHLFVRNRAYGLTEKKRYVHKNEAEGAFIIALSALNYLAVTNLSNLEASVFTSVFALWHCPYLRLRPL